VRDRLDRKLCSDLSSRLPGVENGRGDAPQDSFLYTGFDEYAEVDKNAMRKSWRNAMRIAQVVPSILNLSIHFTGG
jgi:hypothetical protein